MFLGDGEKWKCYVCDPKPIAKLIQEATDIIQEVADNVEKNQSDREAADQSSQQPTNPVPLATSTPSLGINQMRKQKRSDNAQITCK